MSEQCFEGRCACGGVRFRLTSRPMIVHGCHCLDCQRQTGAAFAVNAVIETDRIEVLAGEPAPITAPTDSGRPHDIYRCQRCQTALWSDYGRRPWVRFVRVGTLENPSDLPPDVHIFTRSKQPYFDLPADTPAFEIYYDMQAQWPAESLERRRRAMEG